MSEKEKKNYIGAIIFCLVIFGFPAVTVYLTKEGLDTYKDMRSEMPFLKDSIRVSFDDLPTYWDVPLSNESVYEKMIFVGFWNAACEQTIPEVVTFLKGIQAKFNREDQQKILFVVQGEDHSADSTWSLDTYVNEWKVDTNLWKFTKKVNTEGYKLADSNNKCGTIVLFDGRVSKKDDTGNYKKGPLMCEHYNIKDKDTEERLLKHMSILMPKKERKKIEYKAEESLY